MAADVEVLPGVVVDVVGVQVQLGAVHEVQARGEDRVLLAHERLEELRGHGGFDAHGGDVPLRQGDMADHAVRAARGPQVEAQLVQARLAQGPQVLLRGQGAVGVHVLVDPRLTEAADDAVVLLNLYEGLQVHVGHPRGPVAHGEQQRHVLLPVLAAADLPHALADGGLAVQLAVVVAEFALDVAAVGLADGAQPRARQAGAAAGGELLLRAHEQGAAVQAPEAGNLRHQLLLAALLRRFNLREHRVHNLLLPREKRFILRQLGKKVEPHQRVALGNLHQADPPPPPCSPAGYCIHYTTPGLGGKEREDGLTSPCSGTIM